MKRLKNLANWRELTSLGAYYLIMLSWGTICAHLSTDKGYIAFHHRVLWVTFYFLFFVAGILWVGGISRWVKGEFVNPYKNRKYFVNIYLILYWILIGTLVYSKNYDMAIAYGVVSLSCLLLEFVEFLGAILVGVDSPV